MSSQITREETDESKMNRFERNRYFYGKLMTARDMETEQRYHRARLHEISQHVLGTGLVCGLSTTVEEKDDRLYATIEPGLGLDRRGRPVVVNESQPVAVKNAETGEATLPEGGDIYLFLEYDECLIEAVPVPDSMNACEERCCYNRVVEQFEVIYTEEPPKRYKRVPAIDFPSKDELDEDEPAGDNDPALTEMARSYYENSAVECAPNAVECESDAAKCEFLHDCSLFLGLFEKRENDRVWRIDDTPDRRPFVYTNDMLYAVIARHATDFENPHQTTLLVDEPADEEDNGARVRVNDDRSAVSDVDFTSSDGSMTIAATPDDKEIDLAVAGEPIERLDRLEAYVLEKPLWCACPFRKLGTRLNLRSAGRVATMLDEGLENEIYEDTEEYVDFYAEEEEGLLAMELNLLDEIDRQDDLIATDSFEAAMEVLEEVVSEAADEPTRRNALEVAIAQDRLCTTLECLDRIRIEREAELDCFGFDELDEGRRMEPFEHEGLRFHSIEDDVNFIARFQDVNDDDHLEMQFPGSGLIVEGMETTYVEITVAAYAGEPIMLSAYDGRTEVGRDSTPMEPDDDTPYKLRVDATHDTIDRIEVAGGERGFILQICRA